MGSQASRISGRGGRRRFYVATGDSTTARPAGYVDLVAADVPRYLSGVVNSAVGGTTIVDFAADLDNLVLAYQPTVTTVMFGTNDHHLKPSGLPEVTLSDFEDTLNDVCDRISGRIVLVTSAYVSLIMDDGLNRTDNDRLITYCEVVRGVAATRRLELVDVHALTTELSGGDDEYWEDTYAPDGIHMNPVCHGYIYRALKPVLYG